MTGDYHTPDDDFEKTAVEKLKAGEAYFADDYANKRVAVVDVATGAFKRYWGAYGNEPDDTNPGPFVPGQEPAQQS